jgi:enoyl-CoA hydratase
MTSTSDTDISFELQGNVGVLTLNRAPVNALDRAMIGRLSELLDQIRDTSSCGALLVQSQAKVFCAGADIDMLQEILSEGSAGDSIYELSQSMQSTFAKLESLPIPTLAVIEGAATGGGLELALSCDLRIASASAKLGLPELKLGLVPAAGGTQRLVRVAGRSVATRAILTGELFDGEQAERLGIVDWVQPRDNVREQARVLAEVMAAMPRSGVAAVKRCLQLAESAEGYRAEADGARALISAPETRDRVTAFLDQRKTRR